MPHAQRHPRDAHDNRRAPEEPPPFERLQGLEGRRGHIAGIALAKAAQNGARGVETGNGAMSRPCMKKLGAAGDRLAHGAGGQDAQARGVHISVILRANDDLVGHGFPSRFPVTIEHDARHDEGTKGPRGASPGARRPSSRRQTLATPPPIVVFTNG